MLSYNLSLFSEYSSAKSNRGKEEGVFKRGEAPLSIPPPPLTREGDKGGGLSNKNFKRIAK